TTDYSLFSGSYNSVKPTRRRSLSHSRLPIADSRPRRLALLRRFANRYKPPVGRAEPPRHNSKHDEQQRAEVVGGRTPYGDVGKHRASHGDEESGICPFLHEGKTRNKYGHHTQQLPCSK